MSENKYSNDETRGNEVNNEGENYMGDQYLGDNYSMGPGTYYGANPVQNYQEDPGTPRAYRQNPNQGQNLRASDMFYQQNRQNYGSFRPGNPNYQRSYGQNMQGNYRGDYRMNYPANYQGDYAHYHPYPHHYHHDHDHELDYYDGDGYYNYRGNRPYAAYGPNTYGGRYRQNYDCCSNQTMMGSGSWMNWMNPRFIPNLIQSPRVNNFLRGVGIATVGMILAPSVARTLRPLVVKAVQGAMTATEEIKGIFADAKEDVEDIFAEAKWDGSNCANNQDKGGEAPNM
ncbi:MAG: DUF5132 domain-containing protein [Clostridia bacterium]|nr:DUF5132 domain-containing protein [Clostridia bacterium]